MDAPEYDPDSTDIPGPGQPPSWGIIATVKAPTRDILNFVAHHLSAGAHRIYLYLDDGDPVTAKALKGHKQLKVVETGAEWWAKRKGRPDKHQARQVMNARHACNRNPECDWLIHIDVDEFLVGDVSAALDAVPVTCLAARVRPIEALAEDPAHPTAPATCFKGFHVDQKARQAAAARAYPTWGQHLSGGFLSHVQGKVFFRAGIGMRVKIHNAYLDDDENPGQVELGDLALCHMHAESWEAWRGRFDYRLDKGSYRAELRAPVWRNQGGLTLHELFTGLMETEGEAGLRAFYDEVCLATPDTQARLEAEGLLRRIDLGLDAKRLAQFPGT
ncbi:glycosyltransferase family 2 protein [Mesobacterium pallidum]|uniref:glycosyltransferase family 2 protein n=1 Tax=Mesobacterium pallidum TaxID=2872037 RepID=UPI001EE1D8C1|nr:glycosyltransferase family 2 protein [Mesobacterium pallidum]